MGLGEIVAWSAALGVIVTLVVLLLGEVLIGPGNKTTIRNLLSVTTTGMAVLLLSELPLVLFPSMSLRAYGWSQLLFPLLSAALMLHFLGFWLGGLREDGLVHLITKRGSVLILILTGLLGAAAVAWPALDHERALLLAGGIVMVAVGCAMVATLRASALGDPMAPGMLATLGALAIMLVGLYLKALDIPVLGLWTWVLTAFSVMVFLVSMSLLVTLRMREARRLQRLASLTHTVDMATGLPMGSTLLTKVDDAFWRTARKRGQCAVIGLYVRNLFELSDTAGRTIEHQIATVLAARIRRAAGFRCVAGLYHPRCFIVVIPLPRQHVPLQTLLLRLTLSVCEPIVLTGQTAAQQHRFVPDVGIAHQVVDAEGALSSVLVNQIEVQAQASPADRSMLSEPTLPPTA